MKSTSRIELRTMIPASAMKPIIDVAVNGAPKSICPITIPTSVSGIGHMLFGAPFTATSMIGFIALAGIIVRNSILLVDFINHAKAPDKPLRDTLLEAGMIRFKPIVLTAAAAMIGAATILSDPIFQGLAISLLFGLASSTLLTVLVIPAIYIVLRDDGREGTLSP